MRRPRCWWLDVIWTGGGGVVINYSSTIAGWADCQRIITQWCHWSVTANRLPSASIPNSEISRGTSDSIFLFVCCLFIYSHSTTYERGTRNAGVRLESKKFFRKSSLSIFENTTLNVSIENGRDTSRRYGILCWRTFRVSFNSKWNPPILENLFLEYRIEVDSGYVKYRFRPIDKKRNNSITSRTINNFTTYRFVVRTIYF